ncbi:hypothetical protein LCI18_005796 [Fusarium solani-melongenae]|uniref:Uncharacterized protein n=1 Tax=Fusarium solani subsp. cucurbitae TaxID=2747967 RepID=A0ACD3Z119_FUSSC|nr:hypothetical protein LCI18_005796 [Fusarium solani-melongenae]
MAGFPMPNRGYKYTLDRSMVRYALRHGNTICKYPRRVFTQGFVPPWSMVFYSTRHPLCRMAIVLQAHRYKQKPLGHQLSDAGIRYVRLCPTSLPPHPRLTTHEACSPVAAKTRQKLRHAAAILHDTLTRHALISSKTRTQNARASLDLGRRLHLTPVQANEMAFSRFLAHDGRR